MSASEIEKTIRAVETAAERVIKRTGFSISGELIRTTPYDVGWARANWIISIGTPYSGVAGSRESVTTGPQAQGQARLLVYNLRQHPVIWISNGVPYIQALNAGHSPQAPANFVEQAIDRGVRAISS